MGPGNTGSGTPCTDRRAGNSAAAAALALALAPPPPPCTAAGAQNQLEARGTNSHRPGPPLKISHCFCCSLPLPPLLPLPPHLTRGCSYDSSACAASPGARGRMTAGPFCRRRARVRQKGRCGHKGPFRQGAQAGGCAAGEALWAGPPGCPAAGSGVPCQHRLPVLPHRRVMDNPAQGPAAATCQGRTRALPAPHSTPPPASTTTDLPLRHGSLRPVDPQVAVARHAQRLLRTGFQEGLCLLHQENFEFF